MGEGRVGGRSPSPPPRPSPVRGEGEKRTHAMSETTSPFCTIEEAIAELKAGRMIVLVDDQYRENEGDLVIPAEKATPEAINFMVRNGCGILGLALSSAICDRLHLDTLPGKNV